MESSDLICVYSLTDVSKAEMIKNLLRTEGVRCFLAGEATAANLGLAVFRIDVMVPALDGDRASKLIESHERRAAERSPV
jgi:hypothetical protein